MTSTGALTGTVALVTDPDDWWREVEVNLRGPLLCAWAVLPGMMARRRGRIVNMASGVGLTPFPYNSAYACSKVAVIRLTDSLQEATAQHGVMVFATSPGRVHTAMVDEMERSEAARRCRSRRGRPAGGALHPRALRSRRYARSRRGDRARRSLSVAAADTAAATDAGYLRAGRRGAIGSGLAV